MLFIVYYLSLNTTGFCSQNNVYDIKLIPRFEEEMRLDCCVYTQSAL